MKVLVTGANGYLGQGIVNQLLEDDVDVVATDLRVGNINSKAMCIAMDLFAVENPYEFFQKPDAVLHLTWRDGFKHASDAHMVDLPKHYFFIKKMLESGLKQLAVMGTMHEVGFYEGSIDENTPCHPQNLYGIAKNALRDTTKLLCNQHQATWQWLRGYYIVGNSQYGNSIFSKITSAEKNGEKEFPFTMGQNQYDFLDYDKFCLQVASAVEQSEVNGIINICSGYPEKLADRVERFIKENNYHIKLKYGAYPDRPYDSKAVWGNANKITEILSKRK